MLQHQRHRRILEIVGERTTCTLDELRRELGIASITLYRDLKKLKENNLIRRVHGGVTIRDPDPIEWRFTNRLSANAAVKERIGRAVAANVREGSAIFIDASSTTHFMARCLAQRGMSRLTLVTNSPSLPMLFEGSPQIRLISTGGELHQMLNAYGGPIAMRVLENVNFDTAFISCAGFSLNHGATSDSPVLVELLRQVARRSREVVLLLDSSKFSRLAMMTSLHVNEITRIVTDDQAPRDVVHRLREAGVEVTCVGGAADTQSSGQETGKGHGSDLAQL